MKYAKRKKKEKEVPKAVLGALLPLLVSTGVGAATAAHGRSVAKLENARQERIQNSLRTQEANVQSENVAQGFETTGESTASFFRKLGGYVEPSHKAKGGDLVPLASNVEEVQGNKHNESKIDNTSGVKLLDGNGKPKVEVEDEEVIKDGRKVYSAELKPEGSNKTFADLANDLGTKKGGLQKQLGKGTTRVKQNTLEREIANIETQENQLFDQQEQMKVAQGLENPTVNPNQTVSPDALKAMGGTIKKAFLGTDLGQSHTDTSQGDSAAPEYAEDKDDFKNAFLFADNVVNAINTATKPRVQAPQLNRTPSFKNEVNVNDQLSNVKNAVNRSAEFVKKNTSNSNSARGAVIAANLQGANAENQILAGKENQETANKNAATSLQTRVAAGNTQIVNRNADQKLERKLAQRKETSANVANVVSDIGAVKDKKEQLALDQDKIALYRDIYAGNNESLKVRTILKDDVQLEVFRKDPEKFEAWAKEQLESGNLDTSAVRRLRAALKNKLN
tara:strand:+ start:8170 stop:9690 length:1521 start_codon:yes stop_codon:yes gene_type:complete